MVSLLLHNTGFSQTSKPETIDLTDEESSGLFGQLGQ
jgi:hypothetical protein